MSEAPLRIFLDTYVIFSALQSPSGRPAQLLQAASSGAYQPVLSPRVLDELVRNLVRKQPDLLPSLAQILVSVPFEFVAQPGPAAVLPWLEAGLKEDSAIVAAAISAGSDYLCTGDRGILTKANVCLEAGLNLIRPAELLELLTGNQPKAL